MIIKATSTEIHKIENNIQHITQIIASSVYKMVANSDRQRKELLHEEEHSSTKKNLATVPNSNYCQDKFKRSYLL
jgi:hypothetical protein